MRVTNYREEGKGHYVEISTCSNVEQFERKINTPFTKMKKESLEHQHNIYM